MNRNAWCRVLAVFCLLGLTSCTSGIPQTLISHSPLVELITPTSGTNQSHAVNGTFGAALVATVTTDGGPAVGVAVTFTAPASGASATFADTTSKTASTTTDSNGIAISPSFTANGTAGTFTITATANGAQTPAIFTLTNTTGAPAAITATSGTPQSAPINTAFAAPLIATVLDSGQNPVGGAIVTFTAPSTGASGVFANGTATETDTTNASGMATSTTFTANGASGSDLVTATVAGVSTSATFNLTNASGAPATVTAASGTPQSATINTAFAAPLVAIVLDSSSNPVSGVAVTFKAPTTGASGTFVNGTATEIDTTNSSGLATSTTFTANGTTGGPYTVTASIAALPASASFSLTNRVAGNSYVFYLSGQEAPGLNFYALAGSVQVDLTGKVLAGEQDYNDALGLTSPQPSGDTISGGTLSVNATTGQGTLTLTTNNTSLGVNGVETLGVQFVNSNHALIIQFDGVATSSGSLDLQTLPGALNGGYAFTLSGVDNGLSPVAFGGVFSITGGTSLQSGSVDENDNGNVTIATALSGTLSTPDSFGRGTITSDLNYSGAPIALNYYVVGPEAIRIIDVDAGDSAMGSAFGQGVNQTNASNASLGNSVFGIGGSPYLINYAAAGMLVPSSSLGTFSGVADDNELFIYNIQLPAAPINGTYSINNNGYGSLTITPGELGDVTALGVYLTDPNLNLNDPNNATSGLGGALVADMDGPLAGGTGFLIPQTETSTAVFMGSYAFGGQAFNNSLEFDFLAQGSVTNGTIAGSGFVSDPFLTFGASATNSGVQFSGTPLADTSNSGRYTMFSANPTPNPLNVTLNSTTTPFDAVVYQASGGQLLWIDEDISSVFFGSLQQQGSLSGIPGAGQGSLDAITATSGTPQSAAVNTPFATPLMATVTLNGSPVSGVVVTFTAPATGASGTFVGGSNTATSTTNSSGVATSSVFTANGAMGAYMVTATVAGVSTPANFSLTNTAVAIETITATSGTPQSAAVNTTYASPLAATVATNGSPNSGVVVTFTAPATGASGTFAGGSNTATATTNSSGVATSLVFTANSTTGTYTVTASVTGLSTPANFNLTNTTAATETITPTSGTPQSAAVNTAFASPFGATVTTNGSPTSGVVVTFTAPAAGAGGTFAGGSKTVTATTNSSGVATSPIFSANGTTGSYTVAATAAGVSTAANFDLTNTAGAPTTISATSGTPQSVAINTAFAAPLVATVLDSSSNPVSGVMVTFTAPTTGASGTFAGGSNLVTATTNSTGAAISPVLTANGTTGTYIVTATVAGVSGPANFSLTNQATTYVFYLSGQEGFGPDFYALAGAVQLDSTGNVLAGEQDYNDGLGSTSPQPSGDTITGGSLSVSTTTGQGTLTLITNNTNLGVAGVETLGIQFVNNKHALIVEFDGVATSSGTVDLQTLPASLGGGYAFSLAGVDNSISPVAFGGVFSISGGTTLQNGSVDENDNGNVTIATPVSGTLSPSDSFGRGTIASNLNYSGTPIALNYYVVGPEAIRIIDVDPSDSAIGSAFGQGVNATHSSNAALGTSVFGLNGSPYPANYAAAGMFATTNTSSSVADFSGVADDSELIGYQLPATPISGTYSIASNGYGSVTMVAGDLGDVSALGIYMTDPNLNLNDPNNTSSGLGGGLIADLDPVLVGGTGILIPQADTSTASFNGKYVFGAQSFNTIFEFDFVGQGSVSGGALSGTGLLSDPFLTLGSSATYSGVKFSGTPLADTSNPGRYSLFTTNTKPNALNVKIGSTTTPFNVVIYQANGGQLFWLDEDISSVFFGSLQQQGSLIGIPVVQKTSPPNHRNNGDQ